MVYQQIKNDWNKHSARGSQGLQPPSTQILGPYAFNLLECGSDEFNDKLTHPFCPA